MTTGEKLKEYSEENIYFLDGYTLKRRKEWDGKESKPEKFDDDMSSESTLEEILQGSDNEIAARVLSYVIENRGEFDDLGLQDIDLTVDVKEILNEVNTYIQQNKDKSLLTLAAENIGVKEEVLETAIKTICMNNADGDPVTVADLINRLCLVFKVDLKSTFDELQLSALLSTQEVVNNIKAFVKENVDKDDYDEIAPILFPDVLEDETLYDYVLEVANNFSVDKIISAIVGNDAPTLEDLGVRVTSILKTTDLKTLIAYVMSNIQLKSTDCVDFINDFVTECVNAFEIALKLTVDEYGYPTYFEFAFDVDYDATALFDRSSLFAKVDVDMKATCNIEYSETPFEEVKFEFPSDTEYKPTFKVSNVDMTADKFETALENGYTAEIVVGTGKYADGYSFSSDAVDDANRFLLNGGNYTEEDYAAACKGTSFYLLNNPSEKLAYYQDGKLVLTKEYFEFIKNSDGLISYDWITIYCGNEQIRQIYVYFE